MRDELIAYFQSLKFRNFGVSEELPFTTSGEALYLKNQKKIYVDNDQIEITDFIPTLDDTQVESELRTVTVYFSNDAKLLPPDYVNVLSNLKAGRNIEAAKQFHTRQCTVSSSYEGDLMITQLEFSFNKIL